MYDLCWPLTAYDLLLLLPEKMNDLRCGPCWPCICLWLQSIGLVRVSCQPQLTGSEFKIPTFLVRKNKVDMWL